MRTSRVLALTAAFLMSGVLVAQAGPGRGGPHGGGPSVHGNTGTHGKSGGPHGKSAAESHGKSSAESHGKSGDEHGKNAGNNEGKNDKNDHPGTNASDNSFVDRINRNSNLKQRLEDMLGGLSIEDAAKGFRNQGQFIAAVENAHNNDISFADLKALMTGDHPLSLGQAKEKLNPNATKGSETENESKDKSEATEDNKNTK